MAPQSKTSVAAVLPTLLMCLWLPASPALAQSDNPPPEPRSRATSAADVSAGGALTTGLSVNIPAARGPTPSIGLAYSSASSNGIAGMGWVLTGFPAIVRARDTGMKFDASDQFVFLPGGWGTPENRDNRLVNVSGNYYRKKVHAGSPPEQFRPSNQSCGSGPSGPCYWEMRDGSGTRYYFGGDASAHPGMYAAGSWHGALWEPYNGVTRNRGIVAWPLYKVVDADGNYLVVTNNQVAGTFLPLRVEYNLPLVGAQGRAMSVHFQYENRPDRTPMPSYHSVRLKNIRVYGHSILAGTLIRRYELGYELSGASRRSRLTSFREFGSDGNDASAVALEATTFSYTSNPNASFVGTQATLPYDSPPQLPRDLVPNCQPGSDITGCLWNSFVGDLDGDGKADLVRTYYGSYGGKVLYRCGGDNWLSKPPVEHTTYSGVQPAYLTGMGDFNGDGRQDLVAIYPDAGTFTTYIAYGTHANGTCGLGGWILQPSETVQNVTMSASPADWRLLTADLDGDGLSDVVLFDKKNTVLYWKLYRDNQLSAVLAGRYRSGEWTSCNAGYPYPHTVGFNGIDAIDYNGDGKADIVASWSRMQMDGTLFAGMISVLTVLGTSTGLGPPSEACHTPSTPYGTPAVRYPYTAMRHGDINGDGTGDTILTYQGWAIPGGNCEGICSGVVNGRDIRVRLGTTRPEGNSLQVYATDPNTYPYPSRDERPPHLNQWQFATADINGDGIDDYIQSYYGRQGDRLYYALGTPTGLGPLVTSLDRALSTAEAEPADGGEAHYPQSTLAVGDFNGDGLRDVARIQFHWDPPREYRLCASCTLPKPEHLCSVTTPEGWREQLVTCYQHRYSVDSTIYLGSPGGLIQWGGTRSTFSPVGGDSRALDVLVADLNGDGRDDLLFVNNNAEPPNPPNNRWIPNRQGGLSWLVSSGNPADRLPDLLSTIDNGVLGKTTVSYRLAQDFPNAVKPDWPNQCLGWKSSTQSVGYITGTVCGRVDSRPRALVQGIVRDHGIARNGVTFKERVQYDYNNGRVHGGRPEERADLGFSSVTSTNPDTEAKSLRWYRQDKPFEGLLDTVTVSAAGTLLHRSRYTYFQGAPLPRVTSIHRSDTFSCPYESGLVLPCAHRYLAYDPFYLVLAHSREGTDDILGDNDVYSYFRYHLDSTNWLFRPRSSWTKRANASGTDVVLDMRRLTYDVAAGKSTHVLKGERILFDDAESATCVLIDDPWNVNTCREKLSSGDARWVTTFMANSASYDAQGNLTAFGSFPVPRDSPNPAWEHPIALTYDAEYRGLVASTTNSLNQTTRRTYDAAGRLRTSTDPNNHTTAFGYDVYGRPTSYAPPGVNLYQKRWAYPGVDPVRGYQVDQFTYSSANSSHRLSLYFDGFGGLVQSRDYSGLDGGAIDTLGQDLHISNQRTRRESWPYFISGPIAKFIETTADPWGRPLVIKRVNNDASSSLDYHASGQPAIRRFSYNNPDSLHSVTTAINGNGSVRSIYRNYRGLATKVVDDAGTTTFQYSTGFRLAQVTLPSTAYNTITYAYDSWGRLKTENDPNGAGLVAYTYDDAGMLTRKVYLHMPVTVPGRPSTPVVTRQIFYSYDQLDRIVGERGLSLTNQITYTYDEAAQTNGVGRLTSVTDTSGTTRFNYDGRGNKTSRVITLNGLSSTTYSFSYDDRDFVTSMTLPDSSQSYSYTADGVLTAVSPGGSFAPWASWSDFGPFKQPGKYQTYWHYFAPRWANTTEYTYDADQRVSRLVQKQRDGTTIQDVNYLYDAVGNVRGITDNRATKIIGGVDTDLTQSFAYDPLNRLCVVWSSVVVAPTCSTTTPAPVATFTYDGIGNLITDSGSTNLYSATLSGERRIENKTGTTTNWRAVHDTEGKRILFEDCSVTPCSRHQYRYDYRGRLASVTQDGIVREAYEYDFADRRTKKSYNDLTKTIHSWFIGPSYTERKSSLDISATAKSLSLAGVANRTYGDLTDGQAAARAVTSNINQPFRGDTNAGVPEGVYYRQPDLLGTPMLTTRSEDGAVVTRYKYDVWGNLLAAGSVGLDTSYDKFTGQPREDFSGLAYHGFRYYHPRTRRFITPDDRVVGGGAQGYNRFAYVLNNPATYIDPTGHQAGPTTSQHCYPPPCDDDGNRGSSSSTVSLGNPFDLFKELFGGGQSRRSGQSTGAAPARRWATIGPETRSDAELQKARRDASAKHPIKFQDPRGRHTIVAGNDDVLDVVMWLLRNYRELFPTREWLITEGDPGEGNNGFANPLTGTITVRKGLPRAELADTIAHELLHARGDFWSQVNYILLSVFGKAGAEHEHIHRAGKAIGQHFEMEEKAGHPVNPGGYFYPGTAFFLPNGEVVIIQSLGDD